MPNQTAVCEKCGLPESEHHKFETRVNRVAGCVCDTGTWNDPHEIPDVCGTYNGGGSRYCITCEHEEACHKKGR